MYASKLSFKQRFAFSRFFKGEAAVAGPIELTQRRIFILPTRSGFGVAITIMILLLIAFVYSNNLVYMLAFLLASLFFISILHTFKNLAGLIVEVGGVPAIFAGESAGFTVIITNNSSEPKWAIIASLAKGQLLSLPAQETQTIKLYTAAALHRGWQAMDTLTVASSFPLGIFRAWSPLRFDRKVLVYPKPSPASLPFPLNGLQNSTGDRVLDVTGNDEYSGIRAYQTSDSPRQIHWKAYAKGQGLYSKQYASETGRNTELWLDFDSLDYASSELRLSQLCRWVIDAENAGLCYGLQIPGIKILPDCGQQHQSACLQALALF